MDDTRANFKMLKAKCQLIAEEAIRALLGAEDALVQRIRPSFDFLQFADSKHLVLLNTSTIPRTDLINETLQVTEPLKWTMLDGHKQPCARLKYTQVGKQLAVVATQFYSAEVDLLRG